MNSNPANQAMVRIAGETDDRNIDLYELASARRALRVLKNALGPQGVHALLRDQISAGNAAFREHVERSNGQQASGTIRIAAGNLSAAAFAGWMNRAFARQDVLLEAQPEHYIIDGGTPSGPHIVEALGDHIVGFHIGRWDESKVPGGVPGSEDARRALLALDDDGTVIGAVSTAFKDTADGMVAELSVTLPATSAPAAIDHHLEHFAVEFRNWMVRASAEIGAQG